MTAPKRSERRDARVGHERARVDRHPWTVDAELSATWFAELQLGRGRAVAHPAQQVERSSDALHVQQRDRLGADVQVDTHLHGTEARVHVRAVELEAGRVRLAALILPHTVGVEHPVNQPGVALPLKGGILRAAGQVDRAAHVSGLAGGCEGAEHRVAAVLVHLPHRSRRIELRAAQRVRLLGLARLHALEAAHTSACAVAGRVDEVRSTHRGTRTHLSRHVVADRGATHRHRTRVRGGAIGRGLKAVTGGAGIRARVDVSGGVVRGAVVADDHGRIRLGHPRRGRHRAAPRENAEKGDEHDPEQSVHGGPPQGLGWRQRAELVPGF